MSAQNKKKESGHAGQPGEATAGKAETPLSSAAVASLLRSEFADKEDAEPGAAAEEAQAAEREEAAPETKSEGRSPKGEEEEPEAETAEDAEHAEGEEGEEGQEEHGAEEGQEEAAEEQPQLPEALQEAIEQWEQDGGGELPPALQKLVDKRINKLTGQREEERKGRETAEGRVAELEAAVADLKANGAGQSAPPPSVGHLDEKGLSQIESTSRKFVQDAENFLDGTATAEEEARVKRYMEQEGLDEKGLKRAVRDVNRYLSTDLPEQRKGLQEFRAQEAKVEPVAKKYFPWLDKKDSAEYQQAQEILKWMPELKSRVPGHRIALGVYVLGLKAFEELKKMQGGKAPNAKPQAPVKKAPAKTPAAGAAAPQAAARNGRQTEEDSVRSELNQRPNRENAAKLLALELRG